MQGLAMGAGPMIVQQPMGMVPAAAQVVQPRGSARKFLVFGKSGWIGGLLGRLLDQQGEEFVFADCRLQVRVSVRRSTRLL